MMEKDSKRVRASVFFRKVMDEADIFVVQPSLKIQGRSKQSSLLGFVLSVAVYVLAIGLLIYFSKDMIHKTNPSVGGLTLAGGDQITIDKTWDHKFGLVFDNGFIPASDVPDIFTIHAVFRTEFATKDPVDIPIQLESCSTELPLESEAYCWKPKSPTILKKNPDEYWSQYIVIYFKKCQGTSCLAPGVVNAAIGLLRLQTETHELQVDPYNYSHPTSRDFLALDYTLDGTKCLTLRYEVQNITLDSQDGWITTDPNTQVFTKLEKPEQIIESIGNTNTFLVIQYRIGEENQIFSRAYPQVQIVLAEVLGVLSTVILIARFVILPYITLKYEENLVKNSFRMPDKKPLNLNLVKWISSFFEKQPDVQLFNQGVDQIDPEIDPCGIIQLRQELDRLKKCMLTEDQRILFENLDKPELSLSTSTSKLKNNKDLARKTVSKLEKLDSSLLTEVDKQLLQLHQTDKPLETEAIELKTV